MLQKDQEGQEQRPLDDWQQVINHYKFEEEWFQWNEIYDQQTERDKGRRKYEDGYLFEKE